VSSKLSSIYGMHHFWNALGAFPGIPLQNFVSVPKPQFCFLLSQKTCPPHGDRPWYPVLTSTAVYHQRLCSSVCAAAFCDCWASLLEDEESSLLLCSRHIQCYFRIDATIILFFAASGFMHMLCRIQRLTQRFLAQCLHSLQCVKSQGCKAVKSAIFWRF